MSFSRRLALAVLVAASILASPAHAVTFRWAGPTDTGSIDPHAGLDKARLSLLANIYEPLVRRNRTLAPEPALALSWEQTGPTVWRFHLRPNVKWQDGSPFSAGDVVFSVGRAQSPSSAMRAMLSAVKAVREIDGLTIDFETFRPDPILPRELSNFLIMSKAWCEANNAAEPASAGGAENFAVRHSMGTGPFWLVSRDPGAETVVEKYPGWWDKPAHNLDRVEFSVVPGAAARVAALLHGRLDMIQDVPPSAITRIAWAPGLKLILNPELRTIYLGFDLWRGELATSNVKGRNPFQDQRVREAFALAIDENAIARQVMDGLARPAWLMWGPGVNGYDAALDVRPAADLEKAKQLLAQAGYPNGFGVGFDCPSGHYVNDVQICAAVAAMLARIGIKAAVWAQPAARYFARVLAPNYATDFWLLGWTPTTYDADDVLYTVLAGHADGRGVVNAGGYDNPRLDTLVETIGTEMDQAKRNGLIDEAARIVQHDLPVIPLHQQMIVWAAKQTVDLAQPGDDAFPYRYVVVK